MGNKQQVRFANKNYSHLQSELNLFLGHRENKGVSESKKLMADIVPLWYVAKSYEQKHSVLKDKLRK